VNDKDFTQIDHSLAVESLKAAGNDVVLVKFLFENKIFVNIK
jgi:hypothetical protein